jgi:predicted acylesterase/phospholipase RssA
MVLDHRKVSETLSQQKTYYDPYTLPDFDEDFISQDDLDAFERALAAPEAVPVTALNDWRPIHQRVRKSRIKRKSPKRNTDEIREGFVYSLLKWPLLAIVFGWLLFLSVAYGLTRVYIYSYEHFVSWTGRRERLRRQLQSTESYSAWVDAAKQLDTYLGNEIWKTQAEYAYYDYKTVRRVTAQLRELRNKVEVEISGATSGDKVGETPATDELKTLLENCIKNNFVGVENPRLYSETYYGTKHLVQDFVEQIQQSLKAISESTQLSNEERKLFFKHLDTNYGRTALCLSGGATFAYYHFGVLKALLDTGNLPQIITGTSGGAVVAALAATRTDDELKRLLVPALAYRIRASPDSLFIWLRRWWRTGARFDSLDWARACSWFCRGSLTFREAYERTGRILNVSCVPSDPHSPTILANYLTAPDCVIWSAVLASAAVPGILNPVVLMRKTREGTLAPYSFGHKWKDGSLRTDIPLKALNLHFNVNFSIVSQVNPHINLFFFSPRGSPGRPVTHRRGRGWRGGFLGSSIETAIKLDLQKYLKILRHLELLPRPLGQDWSEIWLQRFSGTITLWPKSVLGDFWHILGDPSPARLARMLEVGERSAWPKIKFIDNRMKVERMVVEGLRMSGMKDAHAPSSFLREQQQQDLLGGDKDARRRTWRSSVFELMKRRREEPNRDLGSTSRRHNSIVEEVRRQSSVFFDDEESDEIDEDVAATTDEDEDEDEDAGADAGPVIDGEENGTRVG